MDYTCNLQDLISSFASQIGLTPCVRGLSTSIYRGLTSLVIDGLGKIFSVTTPNLAYANALKRVKLDEYS